MRYRLMSGEAWHVSSDAGIAEYYREQAAECEALAATSPSPRTREIMLEMVTRSRAFAEECQDLIPSAPVAGRTLPPHGG
jgi:hypothetical protein